MQKDRRYSRRKAARNISISLRPLDPQIWSRYWNATEYAVRDISMVGIGVYSKEKIQVGMPLSVDIRFNKSAGIIRIFGKIEWIVPENNQYRIGVSFSWWKDDQDKKAVDRFLEKLITAN